MPASVLRPVSPQVLGCLRVFPLGPTTDASAWFGVSRMLLLKRRMRHPADVGRSLVPCHLLEKTMNSSGEQDPKSLLGLGFPRWLFRGVT